MIKGIGESLSQLRQSQTVTSHYVAPISGAPRSTPKARPIPKHRLEAYGRWAKVTQEQHNISASQVVLQSLISAKSILGQLNKQLQTCLFSKNTVVEDALHKAEECRRQLIEIRPYYQGKRLLDHHLNLISASQPAALHFFRFRRVDLTSPKNRDERITLFTEKQTLHLLLPANKNRLELQDIIEPVLASIGISIDRLSTNDTVFTAPHETWMKLNGGILMVGEGQRLPAGEPRNIPLEEKFSWQDPREWNFTDTEKLKMTLAKVSKVDKKVTVQIDDIKASHRLLLVKVKQLTASSQPKFELQHLHKFMQPYPFAYQVTSLMAQGNTNREQVSALLL